MGEQIELLDVHEVELGLTRNGSDRSIDADDQSIRMGATGRLERSQTS